MQISSEEGYDTPNLMELSLYQRADKIFVTNQAFKRLEPESLRSVERQEYTFCGAGNRFPSQRGLQGAWRGGAGRADGWLGTEMPYCTTFSRALFSGMHNVQRKY